MKLKIRKANIKDKSDIKKLSNKFQFEEDRNWDKIFISKNKEMFVAEENKKIVGFTGAEYFDWNNTIKVIDIFVHPNYRKMGIGSKLLKFLLEKMKKTKYRCVISEAPSLNSVVKLYQKNGFRKCGYNDRYYSNGDKEIAFWMSYDLK